MNFRPQEAGKAKLLLFYFYVLIYLLALIGYNNVSFVCAVKCPVFVGAI